MMAEHDSSIPAGQAGERIQEFVPDSLVGHQPLARPSGLVWRHPPFYSPANDQCSNPTGQCR